MYVHTNYRGSLFFLEEEGKYIFSTKPLDEGEWKAHPMNTVNAYSNGKKIFEGTDHGNEFYDEDHDLTLHYWTFSGL